MSQTDILIYKQLDWDLNPIAHALPACENILNECQT